MKSVGISAYLVSLIPGVLAVMGNVRGGPWALGAAGFLAAVCVADWFLKDDASGPPDRPEWTPDLVIVLHLLVNSLAIGTLLYGVASGHLPRWRINDATLSTGLNSGLSGIIVAHELIHRRGRFWRGAGVWNLMLVNYSHFAIEHVQGHHKRVGTRRDPSTGRPGEDIFRYLLRTIPGQFLCA